MKKRLKGEKLAVFAVVFLVIMNYPILDIANKKAFIGPFPILYLYILLVWLVFILFLAIFIYLERKNYYKDEKGTKH